MIPAAAYLIFSEQTRRLCLLGGNTEDTRRLIRKLIIHFTCARFPESLRRVAEANLAAVDPTCPESYVLRCLAAVARIVREEERHRELLAQFDGLADTNDRLTVAVAKLAGGENGR